MRTKRSDWLIPALLVLLSIVPAIGGVARMHRTTPDVRNGTGAVGHSGSRLLRAYASRLARAFAVTIGVLLLAAPAVAQRSAMSPSDSSWIVTRVSLTQARNTLRTRDAQAVILLLDTTIVLQFTEEGLARMTSTIRDSAHQDLGRGLLARMVGSAFGALFDHGIAHDVRSLRGAGVDGNRLVLETLAGKRVFDRVELNGRDVMNDFSPADAERFAAAVNRALRQ